jgi:hypothetical protein
VLDAIGAGEMIGDGLAIGVEGVVVEMAGDVEVETGEPVTTGLMTTG